jgi:MYXO-CTERM domain-containing protein
MKSQRPNGNNGHTPGTHSNDILLLDRDSLAVKTFTSVGNFAHTHIVPVTYGAGDGSAAIGILSATLSGMKPAGLQVLPIDLGGSKIMAADDGNKYAVSYFSNSGDVVARGLRNPQNQGRGFLFATPYVKNPGAHGGWMSGISSFTAVPIPTFGTAGDKNFMGLDLCFVPATHLPEYAKVAPGKVIRHDEARVGAPPDPLNPNALPADQANQPGGAGGRARATEEASGCAMSTARSSTSAGAFGLALALGLVAARRRRRADDEVAR